MSIVYFSQLHFFFPLHRQCGVTSLLVCLSCEQPADTESHQLHVAMLPFPGIKPIKPPIVMISLLILSMPE